MFKNDLFSDNAHRYVKFRPQYPKQLFDHIFSYCEKFQNAWDCGTGNGQVAMQLAKRFKNVFATDISEKQLDVAGKKPNVFYSIQAAEETNLPESLFDLITCGQSYHWFNSQKFQKECNRVGRKDCKVAVWGYFLPRIDRYNDAILDDFYYNTIYDHWEEERKYLEGKYKNIDFPFKILADRDFEIVEEWSKSHYFGYLSSWSFQKKFMMRKGYNPLADLFERFELPDRFEIRFPVFSKIGNVF